MPQGVETNPHTIDNKFNSYFTGVAQKLVSKIKTTTHLCQHLNPKVQNSIFLSLTTKEELQNYTNFLSSKKSNDM